MRESVSAPREVIVAHRRRGAISALIGLWSLLAAIAVLQMQSTALIDGRPPHPWREFVPAVLEWLLWIPLTPVVRWLLRRAPLTPRLTVRAVIVHAGGIVAASLIRGLVYAGATYELLGPVGSRSFGHYLVRVVVGWIPLAVLIYGAVVAAAVALSFAAANRASELRAVELGAALSRAELRALQAQLHPHFLFNALHSISGLVRAHATDDAVNALAGLGGLLRRLLTQPTADHIRLADEIEFIREYLAIEHIRFSDRLQVQWSIAPETADLLVPRLILQPLVENAIRHGLSATIHAGRITISAEHNEGMLELSVIDDGPGPAPDSESKSGVGLSATRSRLRQHFGSAGWFALEPGSAGGTIARLRMPASTAG